MKTKRKIKVTKEVFDKAKALLEYNSLSVVSEQMDLSQGTLSRINRSPTFNKYKKSMKLDYDRSRLNKRQKKIDKKKEDLTIAWNNGSTVTFPKKSKKKLSLAKPNPIQGVADSVNKEIQRTNDCISRIEHEVWTGIADISRDLAEARKNGDTQIHNIWEKILDIQTEFGTSKPKEKKVIHWSNIIQFFFLGVSIGALVSVLYLLWRMSL